MFIYDSIWTAYGLTEAFVIRWKRQETFFRYSVSEFRKRREQSCNIPEITVPFTGDFSGLLSKYEPNNTHPLIMGMSGPHDFHRDAPSTSILSSIFSASSKESSSVRHSPFSNCLREMVTARDSSAFSRHDSISSHVLSKSATLIITLVLRPFCVMTMGRCVRAVRAKQSLRVRRYSENGTTSSSRRGREIGFALAFMMSLL